MCGLERRDIILVFWQHLQMSISNFFHMMEKFERIRTDSTCPSLPSRDLPDFSGEMKY